MTVYGGDAGIASVLFWAVKAPQSGTLAEELFYVILLTGGGGDCNAVKIIVHQDLAG